MLPTVAWNTIKENSTVVVTVPEKYTFEPSATPEGRLVVLPRRTGHESIHVACVVNVDVSADHNVVLGTLLAKTRQAQTHMDRKRDAHTRKRKRISRTCTNPQEPYEAHLGLRHRWSSHAKLRMSR